MQRLVIIIIVGIISPIQLFSQVLSGKIEHFANRSFALHAIYADSLIFIDSIKTNGNGEFNYSLNNTLKKQFPKGVQPSKYINYRIQLNWNQYADLIGLNQYEGNVYLNTSISEIPTSKKSEQDIVFYTVFNPSQWNNFAMDSGYATGNINNKVLYDFLNHYKKVKVGENWLLEMSRLFPYSDEFSKTLIKEYYKRYQRMQKYIEQQIFKLPEDNPARKIALAYYKPVIPDYGMPDGERFFIFRENFWTHFNPNDSLFLFSSVLIDKFEEWIYYHHHHKDSIAGLYLDKEDIVTGINSFIARINQNEQNKNAILDYALRKLDKYKDDKSLFLNIYDRWLLSQEGQECGEMEDEWSWARKKAAVYRNLVKGAKAPDFTMELAGTNRSINLYDIYTDYTLLIFWASWCTHCRQEIPRANEAIKQWLQNAQKSLQVIAISLDTDSKSWIDFVNQYQLVNWLNYSELKGWQGSIHKKYNVYATPTYYLLDKHKRIIGEYDIIEKALYYLSNHSEQ